MPSDLLTLIESSGLAREKWPCLPIEGMLPWRTRDSVQRITADEATDLFAAELRRRIREAVRNAGARIVTVDDGLPGQSLWFSCVGYNDSDDYAAVTGPTELAALCALHAKVKETANAK